MRKVISFILVVLGLLGLCACGQNEKDKIVKAYAELHNVQASDVSYKSYGEFDGAHVLIVSVKDMDVATAERDEVVDGVDFHFNVWISFDVYREGTFFTLQEAFDSGWLTHEDLLTVRSNHKAEYEWLYSSYDEPPKGNEKTTIELDAEVEQEIIAAFVAKHSGDKYPVIEDEVSLRCHGAFDGVYVLFVDVVDWGYTTAIERDVIADVEFIYGSGQKMTVYSAGEFYSLSNAYEHKILSRDNLMTVQRNYNGRA